MTASHDEDVQRDVYALFCCAADGDREGAKVIAATAACKECLAIQAAVTGVFFMENMVPPSFTRTEAKRLTRLVIMAKLNQMNGIGDGTVSEADLEAAAD